MAEHDMGTKTKAKWSDGKSTLMPTQYSLIMRHLKFSSNEKLHHAKSPKERCCQGASSSGRRSMGIMRSRRNATSLSRECPLPRSRWPVQRHSGHVQRLWRRSARGWMGWRKLSAAVARVILFKNAPSIPRWLKWTDLPGHRRWRQNEGHGSKHLECELSWIHYTFERSIPASQPAPRLTASQKTKTVHSK